MDFRRRLDGAIERAWKYAQFAGYVVGMLGIALALLAIPASLVFLLLEPAFSEAPAEAYKAMGGNVATATVQIGVVVGAVVVVFRLAARFRLVANALRVLWYSLVVAFAVAALARCVAGDSSNCRENRFISC